MRKRTFWICLLLAAPVIAQEQKPSPLRITGYVQPQYVDDERTSNFAVRRGRIKFTYQAGKTSRFVIQPDFTSSGVTLKDAYVEFVEPWTAWKHTVTAGQFNWPFGFEIMYSSSRREMPERTLMYRTLFPGERDRGAMLSGLGAGDHFNYRIAVVNGNGTAQSSDNDKRKDVVGRLGGSFGPLGGGVSAYRGEDRGFDKERYGVDFQYSTPIPGLAVRGEYLVGKQPPGAGAVAGARSSDVSGWYFYAIANAGPRHQFVGRVDQYDPDSEAAAGPLSWHTRTIGGSYIFHWDANSKVMLAYEVPRRQGEDVDDNVVTVRYQYSF